MRWKLELTDPEEIMQLENYKRWYRWHCFNVYNPIAFENWAKNHYPQILKTWESHLVPDIYCLDLTSWAWNEQRNICDKFMAEQ